MSIRAYALVDYRVHDYRDQTAVVALLSRSLPDVRAVAEYWREADPDYSDTAQAWTARLVHNPPEADFLSYHGPGGFSLAFGDRVARVSGICRWSDFVTIPRLHQIHATGFRSIARALDGRRIVLIPEYDLVDEVAVYDGGSLDECITLLQQRWGGPNPTTHAVTADVEVYYGRKDPIWYVENVNQDG